MIQFLSTFVLRFLVVCGLMAVMATPVAFGQEQLPPAPEAAGPVSSAQVADDARWDDRFGQPGFYDNDVTALVLAEDGTLYAGGDFEGHVARWNGRGWQGLGSGLDQKPEELVLDGNTLYAVGDFIQAGGLSARGIAKWNGTAWSRVGNGTGAKKDGNDGYINSVAVLDGDVYIGGEFTSMDGVAARNIARWDGAAWHPLSQGVADLNFEETEFSDFGEVEAITPAGNQLYVGGDFDAAGNGNSLLRVNNIAVWDGSDWSALGTGVTGEQTSDSAEVGAIAVAGGTIYAGGLFTRAGGQPANNIARWNGAAWQALGEGVTTEFGSVFSVVHDILVDGANVYVGGDFDFAGGQAVEPLARWDGNAWSALATELDRSEFAEVFALERGPGDGLYVGGNFDTVDEILVNNIARWQDGQWHPLGLGVLRNEYGDFPADVYAMAIDNQGRVYVGGNFWWAGGDHINNIALWDGESWHALGAGIEGTVRALVSVGDKLYVGGDFTKAGGSSIQHLAVWDQTLGQWAAIGGGVNGPVYALAYSDGDLYVGGDFDSAGSVTAKDLAYWDGAAWHSFGNKVQIFQVSDQCSEIGAQVRALAVNGDVVYIGGNFRLVYTGGDICTINSYILANHLLAWDRAADEWYTFGALPGLTADGFGYSSKVNALALVRGDLYVGGKFDKAGTVTAANIARLSQAGWEAVKGGVSGFGEPGLLSGTEVNALVALGDDLFVGGHFTATGDGEARFVARFDTLADTWSPLGSGMAYYNDQYTYVSSMAVSPIDVYASGQFTKAGEKASSSFAHWTAAGTAATVTPAGGTVTGDDGTTLQFPAGAVAEDTLVTYTPLYGSPWPAPTGQSIVRSLRLEAMASQPLTTFAEPYTMRIPYTDAQLAAAGITDPSTLNVGFWNGTSWTPLLPCAGCSVDTANKTVTVVSDRASDFMLVGQPDQPQQDEFDLFLPLTIR